MMSSILFVDRILGHINNLYNTTFWALIQQGGMEPKEAEKELAVNIIPILFNGNEV
jgi:tRNA(His) 5'-end guanylyltransferase